jgi:hypothetical protein
MSRGLKTIFSALSALALRKRRARVMAELGGEKGKSFGQG